MAKQRDPVLDSMRGIGIVLMVLGHAGFPGSSFIYLFHMALFFMLSGWFFSVLLPFSSIVLPPFIIFFNF